MGYLTVIFEQNFPWFFKSASVPATAGLLCLIYKYLNQTDLVFKAKSADLGIEISEIYKFYDKLLSVLFPLMLTIVSFSIFTNLSASIQQSALISSITGLVGFLILLLAERSGKAGSKARLYFLGVVIAASFLATVFMYGGILYLFVGILALTAVAIVWVCIKTFVLRAYQFYRDSYKIFLALNAFCSTAIAGGALYVFATWFCNWLGIR